MVLCIEVFVNCRIYSISLFCRWFSFEAFSVGWTSNALLYILSVSALQGDPETTYLFSFSCKLRHIGEWVVCMRPHSLFSILFVVRLNIMELNPLWQTTFKPFCIFTPYLACALLLSYTLALWFHHFCMTVYCISHYFTLHIFLKYTFPFIILCWTVVAIIAF